MKIALINVSKPKFGTGDGVTEYSYQLYKNLKGKNQVDLIYALEETKRNNTLGLIYTQTLFRKKILGLIKKKYDIIHITNHELGFVVKILKQHGEKAKIITTIHDTMRLRNDLHTGIKQKVYNTLTAMSIKDAIEYSDHLLFYEPKTISELKNFFSVGKHSLVPLGVKDELVQSPIKKPRKKTATTIGYLGSFAHNKNVISLLHAAKSLKNNKQIRFHLFGTGIELENLVNFKNTNALDRVEFMGFAPENRIREIYDSFDIFVFPTLGENYSLPVLEAQSRGVPVIVSKHGSLIDEVKQHCFQFSGEKDLADLIIKLSKHPNSKFVTAASAFARSLTWKRTAEETFKVYKKIAPK